MENKSIPDWFLQKEIYEPVPVRNRFADKSAEAIMEVLSKIRCGAQPRGSCKTPASLLLFGTLLYIVLISASRNPAFVMIFGTCLLVRLCFLDGLLLRSILLSSFRAVLLSAFILLPSVFFSGFSSIVNINLKIFISVTLLSLLVGTVSWNKLTSALKFFFVPDIFVLILDITLKYIVLLGGICSDVLTAVRLRSVGKNRGKASSLSGVAGVTFLKSKDMSEDQYSAMCCRGFTGEYRSPSKNKFSTGDIPYLLAPAAAVILFIYLQRVII